MSHKVYEKFKQSQEIELMKRMLLLILYEVKEIKLERRLTLKEREKIQELISSNMPKYNEREEEKMAQIVNPLDL